MAALSHFLAYRTLLTRMMISAIYAALTAASTPPAGHGAAAAAAHR